ncbi:MAG TPA: glycoside hydrolase family 2 TIM barrel-domain containing protein [Candidatus Hydrogenedentes bacterium]|nr:glycoside hydrolase family 2 TIM barrel-domain containing protein [Candidatus Hydrogenedentota bacterium]HPG66865.1 glycoside hydrolase family 2 TIM barrel-domain containing protein [Candidatus Hydrogenedentota bacterium]
MTMHSHRIIQPLDGPWRLILDPNDVGLKEAWYSTPPALAGIDVEVPSVWDLWVPDYDGVGWYFREFEADLAVVEQYSELRFEAADYYAEVWLNGVRLGDHEGGYTPFALESSGALRPGTNRLAVRIVDPHGPEGYGPFKPQEIPTAKEGGYFSFAGLWGSVALVGLHEAHIQDVYIQPDVRRGRLTVTVTAAAAGRARLAIEGTSHTAEGPPGTMAVSFPDHETWSPENPKLYRLLCEYLVDGQVVDTLDVRFGMREFTVKDNQFHLNNRPIFVRAVLHQPDYARTLAAPESPELARRELELAKAAGFNMVRLHIKTAPRITLDLADEIGLLLYEEPPIGWIRKSPQLRERCEREVREMILRDRNHPSVVLWGMLNESGNAGYVTQGGAQTIKDGLCALARRLDPSRLIIDDSGGVNGTREPARFMRPYHEELEPYDDLHVYQRAPVDTYIDQYYLNNGDPDKLYFLSEFGFGGMEDLGDVIDQYGPDKSRWKDARFLTRMLEAAQQGFADRELDRVFGDFAGLTAAARELQCDAARHHIDAIRANSKTAGYCYTQLCDAGHEFCAGVLDRWRRPKPVFDTLKEVQAPIRPIIQAQRTNLTLRGEVAVTVFLANEPRLEGHADLSLQVIGPTNQVLWKKKRSIRIPRHGKELWSGMISASGSPGVHQFVVRLMQGLKVLGQSALDFHVSPPVQPCDVPVHVLDPQHVWQGPCTRLATAESIGAPIHIIPPLANTIRAYPDNDLAQVLAQVEDGAVAIVFEPPDDWNDLADVLDPSIRATSKDAVGAFLGMYHYVKLHPVFEGLPARGLMRQPYRNVVPAKTFLESSDEDICGTFDATPIAQGHYMMGQADWWGSDILVQRYGAGRIVFTHLRILEQLGEDPVADRLWTNMLRHFARRSVPSDEPQPLHQHAVEWLRQERTRNVRRWMVIGEFPNWGGAGHDTAYPPEHAIDFSATYPGWYRALQWRPWFTLAAKNHVLELQEALSPIFEYYPRFDHGTAYAYAEFTMDRRQSAVMKLGLQDATKVWLNGALVYECLDQIPHDQFKEDAAPVFIKQGRNTILVKVSKIPGPFRFAVDFESSDAQPMAITWWK